MIPRPAARALVGTAQYAGGFLCCQGTLLARVQFAICETPSPFEQSCPQPGSAQPALLRVLQDLKKKRSAVISICSCDSSLLTAAIQPEVVLPRFNDQDFSLNLNPEIASPEISFLSFAPSSHRKTILVTSNIVRCRVSYQAGSYLS